MQDNVLKLAFELTKVTEEKIAVIDRIMLRTKMLSMNAQLEASHAGQAGLGFTVVAREMGSVAEEVNALSSQLQSEVTATSARIDAAGRQMMRQFRGERLADLARNVVEIIDRNLYERSCDVRWWATDSAVVDVACNPADEEAVRYASSRLATILRSYTVYLDLWIADRNGKIIANGRNSHYRHARGTDVSGTEWFRKGMATRDGDDFAVCDISQAQALGGAQVATYATAIREGGNVNGAPIGVLGIFFDWEPQARDIVQGVALTPEEKQSTRVMMLNSKHQVIASSGGKCSLDERYPLLPTGERGYYENGDKMICYALTPGYETYRGLGWYGCIESKLSGN